MARNQREQQLNLLIARIGKESQRRLDYLKAMFPVLPGQEPEAPPAPVGLGRMVPFIDKLIPEEMQ